MTKKELLEYVEQEIQDLIPQSTKNGEVHEGKPNFAQGVIDGQVISLMKIEQVLLNGVIRKDGKLLPAGSLDFSLF
jgi:hypothetical protein